VNIITRIKRKAIFEEFYSSMPFGNDNSLAYFDLSFTRAKYSEYKNQPNPDYTF